MNEQDDCFILYILRYKDYYAVYINEVRIRKQDTAQGGQCGEKKIYCPHLKAPYSALPQKIRCPNVCYTYTWAVVAILQ